MVAVCCGAGISVAAAQLHITPTAVRKRIKRGTLPACKGEDGLWYVDLKVDSLPGSPAGSPVNPSPYPAVLVEELSFLRRELEVRTEELRRKDHIIAALTETINRRLPELSPPPAAPPPPQRAWWRFWER